MHLCDGTAGTPDLRNRFVVGAGASYRPGNTGGSASGNMGQHFHYIGNSDFEVHGSQMVVDVVQAESIQASYPVKAKTYSWHNDSGSVKSRGSLNQPGNAITSNAFSSLAYTNTVNPTLISGSGSSSESLPPYYALCYIMKTQTDGSPTVVTNNNPELLWGQTLTVGAVDGKSLTVRMPANPNTDTKYSAGTGLNLNGTTFSISQELLDKINNSGSGSGYRPRVEAVYISDRNPGANKGIPVVGQIYTAVNLTAGQSVHMVEETSLNYAKWKCIRAQTKSATIYTAATNGYYYLATETYDYSLFEFAGYTGKYEV